MNKILELRSSTKIPQGSTINAVLLEIGSPSPSEPDKQPVTLCLPPGDIKLQCNVIGKTAHIYHGEQGKAIQIKVEKEGAAYVSYFKDDKKHFLTLRDGVRYEFKTLNAETKMNSPLDRLHPLAEHFRECYDSAYHAMNDVDCDLVPIALALWMETKAGVTVTTSEAKPDPAPVDEKPVAPPEDPEVRVLKVHRQADKYAKLEYDVFLARCGKAMIYNGKVDTILVHRDAFIQAADAMRGEKPKVWEEIFDETWGQVTEQEQEKMDGFVQRTIEKDPDTPSWKSHRNAAVMFPLITKVETN